MANEEKLADIRIRKVKALPVILHREAMQQGWNDEELVIVKITLEKIVGSPIRYLQERIKV